MKTLFYQVPRISVLSFCILICVLNSCNNSESSKDTGQLSTNNEKEIVSSNIESKSAHPNTPAPKIQPPEVKDEFNYLDTVLVKNTEELLNSIHSNRIIQLINHEYILKENSEYYPQGILFDSIHDFKISGAENSKLLAFERNAVVLIFTNSRNIELDNLIIGHTEEPDQNCEEGVLSFIDCNNVRIENCKLFGSGTIGLATKNVHHLIFKNSSISECTKLILALGGGSNMKFEDSKFHNNIISQPYLAFFSETKEVVFEDSEIKDNKTTKPDLAENSIFRVHKENDQIQFNECTFLNNKNFNWFGDKIKLNSCKIDSSKFQDFQGNYPNATK